MISNYKIIKAVLTQYANSGGIDQNFVNIPDTNEIGASQSS